MLRLAIALVILALAGCAGMPPAGSARSEAAAAQARHEALSEQATTTAMDAAHRRAMATALAAAEERARKAAEDAQARGAVDEARAAWRRAAEAAAARPAADLAAAIAEAQAKAAGELEAKAADASSKAAKEAQAEREADARAAEQRMAQRIAWITGLACLVLGAVLGAVLIRGGQPGEGATAGGVGVVLAILCAAYGAAQPWALWIAGAGLVAGIAWWAWRHRGSDQLTVAMSRALDAARGEAKDAAEAALAAVGKAVDRAGQRGRLTIARKAWKRTAAQDAPTAAFPASSAHAVIPKGQA